MKCLLVASILGLSISAFAQLDVSVIKIEKTSHGPVATLHLQNNANQTVTSFSVKRTEHLANGKAEESWTDATMSIKAGDSLDLPIGLASNTQKVEVQTDAVIYDNRTGRGTLPAFDRLVVMRKSVADAKAQILAIAMRAVNQPNPVAAANQDATVVAKYDHTGMVDDFCKGLAQQKDGRAYLNQQLPQLKQEARDAALFAQVERLP